MGDDTITATTGIPIMATAAFRLHTASIRLCIQNTSAVCHSGVADRTMRPITDQFAAAYLCLSAKESAG
jgi:hypothetical protein